MRRQSALKIASTQNVCIFCALRSGRTPPTVSHQGGKQIRPYRLSQPLSRPPAAAYAVAADEPDESPQPFHHSSPPPSRSSRSAWPSFVPKKPVTRAVEPPSMQPEPAPSEPSSWKCSNCGNTNLPRRNKCATCRSSRSQLTNKNADTLQLKLGEILDQIGGSNVDKIRRSGQREQGLDPSRSTFRADHERQVGRPSAFTPQDNQEGSLRRQDYRQASRSSFQPGQNRGRRFWENGVRGQYLSGGNQRQEWQGTDPVPYPGTPSTSAQQHLGVRGNRDHRYGVFDREDVLDRERRSDTGDRMDAKQGVDSGDRSGLNALLEFATTMNKSSSKRQSSEDRGLRVGATLTRAVASTGPRRAPLGMPPSRDVVPELSTIAPDPGLGEDEGGYRVGKQRHSGRFPEKNEPPREAEGRRVRGRFQSEIEEELREPQVAAAKTDPRLQRKSTRRGSRGPDQDLVDRDEDLFPQRRSRKKKSRDKAPEVKHARISIQLPEFISVENLATALRVRVEDFISRMEDMGFERPRHDHVLDTETSGLIATEFNFEPTYSLETRVQDLVARPMPEDTSLLPPRPPIVTIMGHVDHGKTTILDWLRKSSVVDTEHGGITQHIGAFSVTMPGGKQITFLDTPGHAAFLDMRRRGANVTDIVILVVAADDSVKPQTIEAIKHATDAKVPIIVAMNKVDKEDANVERVKQDLARHGVTVEDYGGEVQAIPVSGKVGKGMAELEEATVTLSELLDHRAEVDGPVEGWVIESKVTIAGRVATVLIRRGTLRSGDIIVAGTTWARIRTLRNDAGVLVDAAPPGTPVQIDGWRADDAIAGWEVLQAEDEDQAKEVVELRRAREELTKLAGDAAAINTSRAEEAEAREKVLDWEAQQVWASQRRGRRPKDNVGWIESRTSAGPKQIHFVVKADVSGSVEAVVNSVSAIGNNEVAANVIRSGVGVINESDVQHLASSGEAGYLISFNQPVEGSVRRLAEAAGLEILDHNIIYKVTDVVKEKLAAALPPVVTQRVVGEAQVGKVFEISVKKGTTKIAGCKISNGVISREKKIRVLKGREVIFDGTLSSLKNVKKDVTEMRKGSECGMAFADWEDMKEGDQVQCYEEHNTPRTL